MHITLDGVARFVDYAEEHSSPQKEEGSPIWTSAMKSCDTLLLGRRTYENWAKFWPTQKADPSATAWSKKFSRFADKAEKVVFSKSLKSADWPNSRIVRGDIGEEVARLKAKPGRDLAVAGTRLSQSFLDGDLADELLLVIFPSTVGRGEHLFRVVSDPGHGWDVVPVGAPGRHDFHLVESKEVGSGALYLHYRRAK